MAKVGNYTGITVNKHNLLGKASRGWRIVKYQHNMVALVRGLDTYIFILVSLGNAIWKTHAAEIRQKNS